MKEAFWGVLIIVLGLFGIVVINIFQNVTVDNDRVYYLIKESTEASAFDALDLTYYRLSGNLRIVEDKFVENLTRRFAENVTIGNYTIVVEDINEMPPKVSLRVKSGITSLMPGTSGNEFNIVNRVDGILETKYSIKEVIDFLGITEEEWEEIYGIEIEVDSGGQSVCETKIDGDEGECMPGDLMFTGFDDVTINQGLCTEPSEYVDRKANYKICNCGVWEEKSEIVSAKRVASGNEYVYTWKFTKTGDIRGINESITGRVLKPICTTDIAEMVPEGIEEVKPKEDGTSYEPSSDNSKYKLCPSGGIRIPIGMKFTMHPKYTPVNSINRYLDWTVTDENVLGIAYNKSSDPIKNAINDCILNSQSTNCLSKAIITAKNVGTSYVNVKTTQGQTAACKIEVFDGNVDSVGCKDITLDYGKSGVMKASYSPQNALYTDFKWSISNSSIATINESSGAVTAKSSGTTNVTVTAPNGKTGTCKLTVKAKPSSGGGSTFTGNSCSKTISEVVDVTTEEICQRVCTPFRPCPICSEVESCSTKCNEVVKSIRESVTYGGSEKKVTGKCDANGKRTALYYCIVKRSRYYYNRNATGTYYMYSQVEEC